MRVCIVPEYPVSLMTGGLQVQALRTYDALASVRGDVDVELFDWSKSQSPADVYHFMGLPRYLSRIVELVREAGRPYVLTLLFGSNQQTLALWAAATRQFVNSQVLRRRERFNAVAHATRVIAITDADARAAQVIYGIDKERISLVPNGVADEFYNAEATAWEGKYGKKPFVLCVGAIQPRKGQLLLAQACNQLNLPLVLLGPVLPGQSRYAAQVEGVMRQNERVGGCWLKSLGNEDPLLHSAYAACRVFALLSSSETQPLSVMEAMAARKPVLLLRAAYSSDQLFSRLPTVPTAKLDCAVKALQQIWRDATPTELPSSYTWRSVAEQLRSIYRNVGTNHR